MHIPFSRVYTIQSLKRIIVYIRCHYCQKAVSFVGHYRKVTDIVKFTTLEACPECCGDYKIYGGVTVGVRTARKWLDIVKRSADRFAELDVKECMIDDADRLVHIPANLRHKSHPSCRKRRKPKNVWQEFLEGA